MDQTALARELECKIQASHGFLLTMRQVAELLAYPSVHAAQRAHVRGILPVEMSTLPRRRGLFTTAADVAEAIAQSSQTLKKPNHTTSSREETGVT